MELISDTGHQEVLLLQLHGGFYHRQQQQQQQLHLPQLGELEWAQVTRVHRPTEGQDIMQNLEGP